MKKKYGYEILQSEEAIGAHGDEKGNPMPIEVGVLPSQYIWGNSKDEEQIYNTGFKDYDYYDSSAAYYYLNLYYDTLVNKGFDIIDVNSITVSEINTIVKNVTGQDIPLDDWYNNAIESENYVSEHSYYILGSLKELLPEKYNWLWGTTYWTRTTDPESDNIYFVDTLGDLCTSDLCSVNAGIGLRPVVTMSAEDIVYTITTKTDGNGTITPSAETEHSGNEVTFVVTPNEGFELKEVKVTDSNGNVITFTDYKFTMPDANVIIEATFVPENPETTAINILIGITLSIISIGIVLKFKQKANWINN